MNTFLDGKKRRMKMAKITFAFHLDGVSLIDDGTTIKRALTLSDGNLLVSSFIAFYGDKDEVPSD